MRNKVLSCIYSIVKEIPDSPISIQLITSSGDCSEEQVKEVFNELKESGLLKRKHYFTHVYRLTEEGYNAVKQGAGAHTVQAEETETILNLLLAEDDLDDALIFEMAMHDVPKKFSLRHVLDGEKLFVELKKLIPDLLFLDIKMPCKDGLSCITEIRQNTDYDHMPVIMITSSKAAEHIDGAYSNGANLYITKPDSIKALTKKLEAVFAIDWKTFLYYPGKKDFVLN
jgi:PleD family two-component response regulator